MSTLLIRPATSADAPLINAAWFESLWKEGFDVRGMRFEDFKEGFNRRAFRLLHHPDTRVRCMVFDTVPDEVLGFSVVAANVAHYAYVKHAFRRQHIAKRLLFGCTVYTHRTKLGQRLAAGLDLQFNPFLLESP